MTVAIPRGALATDGEAYCTRRQRREGRPLTPHAEDPWLTAITVERNLRNLLIGLSRLPIAGALRIPLIKEAVGTVPDCWAAPFAVALVKLGNGVEREADGSPERQAAWSDLWAKVDEGIAYELAARSALYRAGTR